MVEPGARRSMPKDPRGDRLEAQMLGRLTGARWPETDATIDELYSTRSLSHRWDLSDYVKSSDNGRSPGNA